MNSKEIMSNIEPAKRARIEHELSVLFPGMKITPLAILSILGLVEFEHYTIGTPKVRKIPPTKNRFPKKLP